MPECLSQGTWILMRTVLLWRRWCSFTATRSSHRREAKRKIRPATTTQKQSAQVLRSSTFHLVKTMNTAIILMMTRVCSVCWPREYPCCRRKWRFSPPTVSAGKQCCVRLFPADYPHRTALECGILQIWNCFRSRVIANPIKIVELYKNMNNSVVNGNFNKSKATIARILYKKAIKVYVMLYFHIDI